LVLFKSSLIPFLNWSVHLIKVEKNIKDACQNAHCKDQFGGILAYLDVNQIFKLHLDYEAK
jgi:hypothetical protein